MIYRSRLRLFDAKYVDGMKEAMQKQRSKKLPARSVHRKRKSRDATIAAMVSKPTQRKAYKKALSRALFTSNTAHWTTPDEILDPLRTMGSVMLDPCSNANSLVNAKVQICSTKKSGVDFGGGLTADWSAMACGGLTFVNWPYGTKENRLWARKVVTEAFRGVEIVVLVAARTAEIWWHDILLWGAPSALGFVKHRLKFSNAKCVAPFSSCIFYWGPRVDLFKKAYSHLCFIVENPRRGNYPLHKFAWPDGLPVFNGTAWYKPIKLCEEPPRGIGAKLEAMRLCKEQLRDEAEKERMNG